jgi:UDP-glucose:(heptosyl)LPS alpha-1,3-glucosyltransferase
MKIGLVCRQFLASKGGLEKYTLALSAELVRQGHEVHVFANTKENRPGVIFHHVPFLPFSSPIKNLSFALMASRRIAEFELDVVQSMDRIWTQDIFRASDGINPIQMRQRYRNPINRQFKALTPRRQVLTLLEKHIIQDDGARYIVANSKMVKDQIRHFYRVSSDKIQVIYNSVDTSRFNPAMRDRFINSIRAQHGVGADEWLILFVGNGYEQKGLPMLMQAVAADIGREKIRLMVVGSDSSKRYRRWAQRLGIAEATSFLGYQKGLERLYGTADLLVLPTRYDPFANVCLEAMACGTPVITTRMNGVCEIIDHGRDGYILERGTGDEIAARIKDFIAVADKSAMRQRAFSTASTLTMGRHMERIMALYTRVYEEKSR